MRQRQQHQPAHSVSSSVTTATSTTSTTSNTSNTTGSNTNTVTTATVRPYQDQDQLEKQQLLVHSASYQYNQKPVQVDTEALPTAVGTTVVGTGTTKQQQKQTITTQRLYPSYSTMETTDTGTTAIEIAIGIATTGSIEQHEPLLFISKSMSRGDDKTQEGIENNMKRGAAEEDSSSTYVPSSSLSLSSSSPSSQHQHPQHQHQHPQQQQHDQQHDQEEQTDEEEEEQQQQAATSSSSFLQTFLLTKGPPQIVLICVCIAIGFGCIIGIVPTVMTTQYARIYYNYTLSDVDCSTYTTITTTKNTFNENDNNANYVACQNGNTMAQSAVAIEELVSNLCTFFTSTYIGSMSDMYGRKPIMILGIVVNSLSTIILLLIQLDYYSFYPTIQIDPFFYYSVSALSGCIPWLSVALSSISDVVPKQWRAPSYGLVIVGFSFGFALAPQIAIIHNISHITVTIISLIAIYTGLLTLIVFVPETLHPTNALHAQQIRKEQEEQLLHEFRNNNYYHCSNSNNNHQNDNFLDTILHSLQRIVYSTIYRPLWELSILNRNTLFRLLSCLAFFSGMVSSGDRTLLIYYIEEHIQFNDHDIATMFLIMGLLGIIVQSIVLKLFNDTFGERYVVMIAFIFGIVHNVLYTFATTKHMIFISVAIGTFVGMSFPTISAIKSNNVDASEQGRIQGALYSLSSLAAAFGPVSMRFIYQYTKDTSLPGSMFLFAAALYSVATYCAYLLPVDSANSKRHCSANSSVITRNDSALNHNDNHFDDVVTVETPLLRQQND